MSVVNYNITFVKNGDQCVANGVYYSPVMDAYMLDGKIVAPADAVQNIEPVDVGAPRYDVVPFRLMPVDNNRPNRRVTLVQAIDIAERVGAEMPGHVAVIRATDAVDIKGIAYAGHVYWRGGDHD